MSLFRCPLCSSPLTRTDRTYTCPKGHSFDRAREGYVHLLPANQKHAKDPGDDKEMAAARNRFLSGGWYAPPAGVAVPPGPHLRPRRGIGTGRRLR